MTKSGEGAPPTRRSSFRGAGPALEVQKNLDAIVAELEEIGGQFGAPSERRVEHMLVSALSFRPYAADFFVKRAVKDLLGLVDERLDVMRRRLERMILCEGHEAGDRHDPDTAGRCIHCGGVLDGS